MRCRWDLSPQGNKELLVVVISVAFLKCNTPIEYIERIAGDEEIDVFNFVLPIRQCANKKGKTVGAKVQEALTMVGLEAALEDEVEDQGDASEAAQNAYWEAEEAEEAAQEAQEAAQEAQEAAQEAQEAAQEAQEAVQEAQEAAQEALEAAQEAHEAAQEAPEAHEAAQEAPETAQEALEAAHEAQEVAREAQEAAQEAREAAQEAREAAQEAPEKARVHHSGGKAYCTSDQGSENRPAMEALFGAAGFVFIHCLAHALNLCFTHACDTLPGKRSAKQMSHRAVAWGERLCNLLRRYWQSFSVYTRCETKWPVDLPKPPRGVRTRWLSIILEYAWLMPKIKLLRTIIFKYYLKDKTGKFSVAFQQVNECRGALGVG